MSRTSAAASVKPGFVITVCAWAPRPVPVASTATNDEMIFMTPGSRASEADRILDTRLLVVVQDAVRQAGVIELELHRRTRVDVVPDSEQRTAIGLPGGHQRKVVVCLVERSKLVADVRRPGSEGATDMRIGRMARMRAAARDVSVVEAEVLGHRFPVVVVVHGVAAED